MGKKFSYKKIAAKLEKPEVKEVELSGEMFDGMTIAVRSRLSMAEVVALVESIATTVVDMEEATYREELEDAVVRIMILDAYAGCGMGENDLAQAYDVVMRTELYFQVIDHIDEEQLMEVLSAVHSRIEFYKNLLLSTAGMKAMEMMNSMAGAVEAITNVGNQLQGMDMNATMGELLEKLNGHPMDEVDMPGNIVKLPKRGH